MSRPAYSLGITPRPTSLIISILAGAAAEAAFAAHTLKFTMPQTGKIIGMTLAVALAGGTHSTSTLDVKAGANSLLTAAFDVAGLTPGTPVQKEVADLVAAYAASVAKDTEMSIVTAVTGGTSPTWGDVLLQIDYIPLGD